MLGISITNFVYYYWYEWTRGSFEAAAQKAGRASKKLTTVESMIAGAIAGSATVILTNPIWVVNTRMTTRKHQAEKGDEAAGEGGDHSSSEATLPGPGSSSKPAGRPTTVGTLLSLLKNEGPRALFAGVVPALVLVINPILQYTLFEQMKNAVERKRRVTPTIAFFLGALGKLFATTVTYPYITVKSRMHVASEGDKEGMFTAIRRVIKEEGYPGLYNGKDNFPSFVTPSFLSSPLFFLSSNLRRCDKNKNANKKIQGIGPKVTQSVLTAAFLFAFKDVLYEQTVRLRSNAGRKSLSA